MSLACAKGIVFKNEALNEVLEEEGGFDGTALIFCLWFGQSNNNCFQIITRLPSLRVTGKTLKFEQTYERISEDDHIPSEVDLSR